MKADSVKLSNGLRINKRQNSKRFQGFKNGAHYYYQNYFGRTSWMHMQRYYEKFGYQQDAENHPVLKELKDSFDSKLQLWFPNHFAKELGRKDKYQRPLVTGFKPKKNPVLNFFQKLDKRLVRPVLKQALNKIVCDKQQKKRR